MANKSEIDIMAECLEWLAMNKIMAWRNNTGAYRDGSRFIRYGYPGSADILGVLPWGQFLAVECKTEKGKQNRQQVIFQMMIERNNGVYILARCTDDIANKITLAKCS